MITAKGVLGLFEQEEHPTISAETIDQIKETLDKYGVKSVRSFKGWDLSGGLADDRNFLSLGVKEEGFCIKAKTGNYTLPAGTEAQARLNDIMTCLSELAAISPILVAK